MNSSRGLVAMLVLLSGCYFYYPRKVPKLNGALVVEGEQITFTSRTKQIWTTCVQSSIDRGECQFLKGKWQKTYPRYYVSAHYAGRTLTKAEFYELTVPNYPAMVAGVTDRKAVCSISLVPTALAIASAIAAIGIPTFMSTKFDDDEKKTIYIAGAAGAVGFSLLSYPIGGFACVKANSLSKGLMENSNDKEFVSNFKSDFEFFEKLADDFNNGRTGSSAPKEEPPIDDAPEETPPDTTTPPEITPPAVDKPSKPGKLAQFKGTHLEFMTAAGIFKTFLKLIDAADLRDRLAGKEGITVFAPTDAAFAKLPKGELDKLLAPKAKTQLQARLLGHMIQGTYRDLSREDKSDSIQGAEIAFTVSGTEIRIGDVNVIFPGTKMKNGVLYPLDGVLPAPDSAAGGSDSLLGVATSAGKYSLFLKALENADVTEFLATKGNVTVFAPTDEAFGKIPKATYDMLFNEQTSSGTIEARKILLRHFVKGDPLPFADLPKNKKAKTVTGGDLVFKKTGKSLSVTIRKVSGTVTDPKLSAGNGLLYTVDAVFLSE